MQFVKEHPKFLKNPMYVTGISYSGIVIPIITEELYKGISFVFAIYNSIVMYQVQSYILLAGKPNYSYFTCSYTIGNDEGLEPKVNIQVSSYI